MAKYIFLSKPIIKLELSSSIDKLQTRANTVMSILQCSSHRNEEKLTPEAGHILHAFKLNRHLK